MGESLNRSLVRHQTLNGASTDPPVISCRLASIPYNLCVRHLWSLLKQPCRSLSGISLRTYTKGRRKKMKTIYAFVLFVLVLAPTAAKAADHCTNEAIEPLVSRLAQAWATRKLGSLDKEKPYRGSVQVVVDHSTADKFEVKEKPNFEAMEQWLRSQEHKGVPARETRPLLWCAKGLCVFDFSAGIAHNHRYLRKVTYGHHNGCVYIKSVFLLDGD